MARFLTVWIGTSLGLHHKNNTAYTNKPVPLIATAVVLGTRNIGPLARSQT